MENFNIKMVEHRYADHVTYEGSEEKGDSAYGYYTLHAVTVIKELIINDEIVLDAVYQTAVTYDHNSYSCPCPELELSEEGGASEVLCIIDSLSDDDFENEEYINEILQDVQELCPVIDNVEKMHKIYQFLLENQPDINDFDYMWEDEEIASSSDASVPATSVRWEDEE